MTLKSYLDLASRSQVAGWAQDDAQPGAPVSLLILHNDVLVARVLANGYRADLAAAEVGDGRHGFAFDFPRALALEERHVIRVCREADGADIERSPVVLEPAEYSDVIKPALVDMLARRSSAEELERTIELLVEHVDKSLQQLAERRAGRVERDEYRHFLERWRRRSPASEVSTPALAAAPPPRALVIDDRVPELSRDAGSVAILSHMRSLQRLGYQVTFAAALEFAEAGADRAALDAIGVARCCAPYYASVEEVLQRQAGGFDVVYLHRISNAAKYGELVRHHFPKARLVYSVADLHHLRLARQAAGEDRPELARASRRVRLLELTAAALADAVITHSSDEAEILRRQIPGVDVHVLRWSVSPRPTTIGFERRRGIAFVGGYDHPPNVDAARRLIADIMPLVRQRDPTIECLLVGGGLPEPLLRHCGNGITAAGRVADLAGIFDRVRLTVAPLSYGAGIKGKVIESLAAGVPCICTPIAAEGMNLPPALHASVAENPEAIAAAIHRLHRNKKANDACRRAGLKYIEAEFSEQHLDASMLKVVGSPRALKPAPPKKPSRSRVPARRT